MLAPGLSPSWIQYSVCRQAGRISSAPGGKTVGVASLYLEDLAEDSSRKTAKVDTHDRGMLHAHPSKICEINGITVPAMEKSAGTQGKAGQAVILDFRHSCYPK